MSKLLNLGKTDEKRNSDHSDNEDDEFKRVMIQKKTAEVDVSLFHRKLHRRRKMKKPNLESGNRISSLMVTANRRYWNKSRRTP